ncbi:MAG TPA: hypothetical protein DEF47_10880 [Herpetosiphon sp.]|uniref:Lumazine-binding n=1 Tax=Herpetosiphon aurantiacus (strain ATCC 23779 / DSM 785 / 114-95) TaxID=316274 RepID=A9AXY9_HERA2|nr:nuclear transport factor 2 family protein [Herpetosiphon sp.]ABX04955.1 conserved hypothetical protein [Herpetosiphon aurantiacus DSM 785]HBW50400.1 hypothetical protein [Herpetosiphon sp.]
MHHSSTNDDIAAIQQAALDYLESQHNLDPAQMQRSIHPRMVKRTFWTHRGTGKQYLREASAEEMILLAASYNRDGDKFPATPRKTVEILDVQASVASVKLTADEWIDYMHLVKINDQWTVINVLWAYHDQDLHR